MQIIFDTEYVNFEVKVSLKSHKNLVEPFEKDDVAKKLNCKG
jgi:hypothetical protein